MAVRIPPPPPMAKVDPAFNRWLIEVASVLSAAGQGVDPGQIPGLANMQQQIANLQTQVALLNAEFGSVNTLVNSLVPRNQVFNGTAAPVVSLGVDGDWYYNRTGAAGARLYIHVGGVWVAQAI